jgi:hypothetical protein
MVKIARPSASDLDNNPSNFERDLGESVMLLPDLGLCTLRNCISVKFFRFAFSYQEWNF